jgi:molecular chaperone HtpG
MTTDAEQISSEPTAVPFRTEVKQLLQILAHSLYTDREIFLRELISNASDAIYRAQFEMLTNHDVFDADAELAIHVDVDPDANTITISDAGIGMTAQEMADHLGTIAQSGARAVMERIEASQRSEIIGQFGVGFYSAFVVADEVTVISRSYRADAEAAQWQSTGDETYTLAPAEREHRGTTIILKLKEDAKEFAQAWKIKQIIKRHSDFVAWPIYVGEEQANQQTALWRTSPRSVEAEQYNEFYRQLTFDFEVPLLHMHLSTEAPVDLHSILFVPSKRERGLIERRVEGKIKLYSRKVLIQEEAKDLLPSYFRFIEGVVDSEDLPLNVSREMVQSNGGIIGKIKKTLTSRLTKELVEKAEKDPELYEKFWTEFGVFIKEGIAIDAGARSDLTPLLRFHTTHGEGLSSLAQYVERMIDGQEEIYYVMAGDLASARRSPHLDVLTERGIEALLLHDVMDGFMLSGLQEFAGHKLRNVDSPDLKLPGESQAPEATVSDESFGRLVSRTKDVLGESIKSVRASDLLRNSPARLVSADDALNPEMERVQRILNHDYQVQPKVLELNRSHPLITDLARLIDEEPENTLIEPLVAQLYDSALLLDGLHPNPADMVERIQKIMEAAARKA